MRAIVSSLVYHRKTDLLAAAQTRGLQTIDGAGMLLHQGVLAFEIWTGVRAPIEPMRAALAAAS
jgi:shikimate dehydrogenase